MKLALLPFSAILLTCSLVASEEPPSPSSEQYSDAPIDQMTATKDFFPPDDTATLPGEVQTEKNPSSKQGNSQNTPKQNGKNVQNKNSKKQQPNAGSLPSKASRGTIK